MDVVSKKGSFVSPTFFIYKVTHKPTNKIYIGQTNNIDQRIFFYLQNSHGQCLFHLFLKQYPIQEFMVEFLESELTQAQANEKEQHYISLFESNKTGLNVQAGGVNNFEGMNLDLKNQYNHSWTVKFTNQEVVSFIQFLKDTNGFKKDTQGNICLTIKEEFKYEYKRFAKQIGARWNYQNMCWQIDADNDTGRDLWKQMVSIYKQNKGEAKCL